MFSIGGYINPAEPHVDARPPLPGVRFFPELKAAVDAIGSPDNLRVAQEHIPEAIFDWADVIVYHHYLDRLYGQWDRIQRWLKADSAHRVIWRTVGQSVEGNEITARPFRQRGLEIVRYSPKEANIPGYAGSDALIRFYKDPDEWSGWTGDVETVLNITQDLFRRDPYTNWTFWEEATKGLPRTPVGIGSEQIGGPGRVSYDRMKQYLRESRVYLYTGTQPASYTLGLIEAMMTGIPVVSIGPSHMTLFPYGPSMFEGHQIALAAYDNPKQARVLLQALINPNITTGYPEANRQRAIDLFGKDTIGAQWGQFLDIPALVPA